MLWKAVDPDRELAGEAIESTVLALDAWRPVLLFPPKTPGQRDLFCSPECVLDTAIFCRQILILAGRNFWDTYSCVSAFLKASHDPGCLGRKATSSGKACHCGTLVDERHAAARPPIAQDSLHNCLPP
jgi:hypothetical protein